MSDGFRTTTLPEAETDPAELIGNVPAQGIGPFATRRVPISRLQSTLLSSTGLIGLRFIAAEGRLTTLEGLAGIPGGANLAADVAASTARVNLLTRALSVYRPSDLLTAWTDQTQTGVNAAAIVEGSAFSLQTGIDGKVLRIASNVGTRGVGPIHPDQIYASETYEYAYALRRNVDLANSTLFFRLRGFKADDTDAGVYTLLTRTLTTADLFKTILIRISGADILAAMPLAVKARPYIAVEGANNGALDVSDIRRRIVDAATPDQNFTQENVTGFSSAAASMKEDQIFFVHGQSLAGGQNLNDSDPMLGTVAKYPGYSLSMEPLGSGTAPRLGGTPPDTFIDLIERATSSARETMLSGFASHTLRTFDLETPPRITVTISGGSVTGAVITKRGYGYAGTPTITLNNAGTGGTGASLEAVLSDVASGRELIGVNVVNGGTGYTSAPVATVAGNGTETVLPRLISVVSYKVGAKYIQLRLGENRNTYIDVFLRAAKAVGAAAGRNVRNYAWLWKQGEADLIIGVPRQPEDFRNFMFQYYRQRADATKAALGQALDPILIIDPAGTCHPDYDQWSQPYPRGLELIRRHPHIRLTGGSYVYPHSDASHLTCAGYNHAGQGVSRAYIHECFMDGWQDIHPTRGWRTGTNTFAVEFAVPPPETPLAPRLGLVIDLSDAEVKLAGLQGYAGFAARSMRDGRVVPITGITVRADGRTLDFTHQTSTTNVAAASVNAPFNQMTVPETIGWETGVRVRLTTTGTLPGGLVAGTDYWICRQGSGLIKFATSLENARNATVVTLTSAGTGTHTITADATLSLDGPVQLVYATRRNPGNNNDDGPILGARGCLRNNRAQPNMYDGYLSHDWATPFDIVVV